MLWLLLVGKVPNMQLIYIDEAGISAVEPVAIVVGVIVGGDDKWRAVSKEIDSVFDRWVPPELRKGFIFHATDVYSGGKHRQEWGMADRMNFFKDFLGITIRMGLPISLATVDRRNKLGSDSVGALSSEKFDHLMAYMNCVSRADKYLRVHSKSNELGMVVAEDSPGMKKYLKAVHEMLKEAPIRVTSEMLHDYSPTDGGDDLMVGNIIDCPHFVDKPDAVMIQLADAWAFSFRRYFAGLKNGDDLVCSVLGKNYVDSALNKEHWGRPTSATLIFSD